MRKYTVAVAFAPLLGNAAQAQVNDATFRCQKVIKKAVEKFIDQTADAIEKCLMEVQRCNLDQQLSPADCKAQLLVVDKGKCAVGKLASDTNYFGTNSSQNHEPYSKALITKALGKLKEALRGCDLVNVNFAALNLAVPGEFDDFVDSLNLNPTGAACLAHKRVKVAVPNRDQLFDDINSQLDYENFPESLFAAHYLSANCK